MAIKDMWQDKEWAGLSLRAINVLQKLGYKTWESFSKDKPMKLPRLIGAHGAGDVVVSEILVKYAVEQSKL